MSSHPPRGPYIGLAVLVLFAIALAVIIAVRTIGNSNADNTDPAVTTAIATPPSTPSATASATSRPLTPIEASRLASAQLRLSQAQGLHIEVTGIQSSAGPLTLTGDIDVRNKIGNAVITGGGSQALVQWNQQRAVFWVTGISSTTPPSTPPTTGAQPRPVDAATDLDAVLLVLLQVGHERLDVAQLLRQGAAWERSDSIDGSSVDVFISPGNAPTPSTAGSAPAAQQDMDKTVKYWVDTAGNARRLSVTLASTTAVIDLSPTDFHGFTPSPELKSN